ncbi:hypothetical protein AB1Y20_013256 [Prymnesium parvum]|uniref:Methyltransferase type 11 domain-containing protein n=1 Tax=Prymnesium parvum TaxID=97485 RepID=A0AB34IK49_PRYPA
MAFLALAALSASLLPPHSPWLMPSSGRVGTRARPAAVADDDATSLLPSEGARRHGAAAAVASPSPPPPPPPSLGRWLLDAALASPLYRAVLVPQAKATMVRTAEANGVAWRESLRWIEANGPWELTDAERAALGRVPEYYTQPFHAYERGNLCWEAALEAEIASRAVGARNMPSHGAAGEEAFRSAFDDALAAAGARLPRGGVALDLGCGTGLSTRRLAARFPHAARVEGLDLSPHFVAVARRLPALAAAAPAAAAWRWVHRREEYLDRRVEVRCGAAEATGAAGGSVDVVNLALVLHELPPHASLAVAAEAYRVLRPGGQLWVTEMDFETPAFSKLRANPVLFALIRATEPYLDLYADFQPRLADELCKIGFGPVRLVAATGRHFALVATKGVSPGGPVDDRRVETAKQDTHLKSWESKRPAEASA